MEATFGQETTTLQSERGQALTDYIAIVIPVAIAVLSSVQGFGTSVRCRFELVTTEISSREPSQQCIELLGLTSNGDSSDAASSAPAPVTPPPPPAPPIAPGTDPIRHHIGDGLCSGPACGGNLAIEGTRFDKIFSMDLTAVQAAGIEFIRITFLTEGITFLPNNNAQHIANSLLLNDVQLGTIVNGFNEFIVPVSELQNVNVISVLSGAIGSPNNPNFDDFEFFDLAVTFVDPA